MGRKLYKKVEQHNGSIDIYGSNRAIKLQWAVPEWSNNLEQYFVYGGLRYYLSLFMDIQNKFHFPYPPEWIKEFDGYMNDTFFSGVVIKLNSEDDSVKAFTFIS